MVKMKLLFALLILEIVSTLVENAKDNQFTVNVYREVAKKYPKTFLMCPLSVKLVLGLVQMGAGGKTAEQLAKVLDLPNDPLKLQSAIRELLPQLQGNQQYVLKTANKIYVRDGLPIKKKYKSDAVNVFKADIQNVNFRNSERVAKEINGWIQQQTDNKITNMVGPGDFSELTDLVLVNAMYFRGKWKNKFYPDLTVKKDFYRGPKDNISIDMMETTATFNYYKSDTLSATFLEMPYDGQDVNMTLVLPDTFQGLSDLEARIADVLVPSKYEASEVTVFIPKFRISTRIEFRSILNDLGVRDAFGPNANFSGISKSVPPISAVIQKTFIEVDEEGTTAAAATIAKKSRSRKYYQEFMANRPFIFYLKSKTAVLFIGRYTGPGK